LKRIFLFIVTNLAVLALLSAVIFVVEQGFGLRLPQGGRRRMTPESPAAGPAVRDRAKSQGS